MKPTTDVRTFVWAMAAMFMLAIAFNTYQYRSALRLQREREQTDSPKKWVILASYTPDRHQGKPSLDLNTIRAGDITRELGIDRVIAKKIIKYRQRLGGYISTRQVEEIQGIDSESAFLLEKHGFVSPSFTPNKIPLARSGRKKIANHPYLAGTTGNALLSHLRRRQVQTWNDLLNIDGVIVEQLMKARPYLSLPEGQSISQNL